jgi:hypothetical protein
MDLKSVNAVLAFELTHFLLVHFSPDLQSESLEQPLVVPVLPPLVPEELPLELPEEEPLLVPLLLVSVDEPEDLVSVPLFFSSAPTPTRKIIKTTNTINHIPLFAFILIYY